MADEIDVVVNDDGPQLPALPMTFWLCRYTDIIEGLEVSEEGGVGWDARECSSKVIRDDEFRLDGCDGACCSADGKKCDARLAKIDWEAA